MPPRRVTMLVWTPRGLGRDIRAADRDVQFLERVEVKVERGRVAALAPVDGQAIQDACCSSPVACRKHAPRAVTATAWPPSEPPTSSLAATTEGAIFMTLKASRAEGSCCSISWLIWAPIDDFLASMTGFDGGDGHFLFKGALLHGQRHIEIASRVDDDIAPGQRLESRHLGVQRVIGGRSQGEEPKGPLLRTY